MMATAIDPKIKGAAIAELATGAALSYVAKKYGLGKTTVSRWKNSPDMPIPTKRVEYVGTLVAAADGTIGTHRNDIGTEKKREIGEQLYDYLEASLTALTVQLRCFSDVDWIKKQPAGELANLHGVCADKTARLLAAYQRGQEAGERSGGD